ncbi:MAG: hypothetical protein ACYC8T_34510, partial [Myxococcaceae bacterium]
MLAATSSLAATPEPNPRLAKVKRLFEELKFSEAARAADDAWALQGNDRDTVIELLKLQGVTAAIMGQADRARAAFRALLVIDPEAMLVGEDLGPKVMGPFFEAKGRAANEGALRLEAAAPTLEGARVERLNAKVSSDPLQMARRVRFSTRAPGKAWMTAEAPVKQGQATLSVGAEQLEWWAELLGDHGQVLAIAGGAEEPLTA